MNNIQLLQEAKKAIREGNRAKAWRLLHAYVSSDPDNIEAWLLLGGLAKRHSRLRYLRIAQRIAPQDIRVRKAIVWAEAQEETPKDQVPTSEETHPHAIQPEKKKPVVKTERFEPTPSPSFEGSAAEKKPLPLEPEPEKETSSVLRWIKYAGVGIFIVVMLFLLVIGVSSLITGKEPEVFGHRFIIVTSGSMEPTFHTGSIIVINTNDGQIYKTNDVVTFWSPDNPDLRITHRIIKMDIQNGERVYQTKGDNNDIADQLEITDENIIGEYTGITLPLLGYFFSFIKSREGLILLAFLFGLYLIVTQIFRIKELMSDTSEA